jgi:hypothetical protein
LAQSEGARVIVAGRDHAKLTDAYDHPDIGAETVDVTNTFMTGMTLRVDGGEPLT